MDTRIPIPDDQLDFELAALKLLDKDTKVAARQLDRSGARPLVYTYYRTQKLRIVLGNQIAALVRSGSNSAVLRHFYDQYRAQERQMVQVLGAWAKGSDEHPNVPGNWLLGQKGIGPVLAAGILAYIDITRAPVVGHIWRFAGLDPTAVWINKADLRKKLNEQSFDFGQPITQDAIMQVAEVVNRKWYNLMKTAIPRETLAEHSETEPRDLMHTITMDSLLSAASLRPHSAEFKVIMWRVGDSFVKTSTNSEDGKRKAGYYGMMYRQRKQWAVAKNERGGYRELAAQTLVERNIQDKKTRATYESGKLPDGRIELMSRRYAEKLLLSHLHHVMYKDHYGVEPPKPYPIAYLGHVHYLPPPESETAVA